MMRLMNAIMFVAIIASTSDKNQALAANIDYSWSGQLLPTSTLDTWHIGPQGAHFDLQVVVSADAQDILAANVEFAAFSAESASLILEGQPATYLGGGEIDFTDNWGDLSDLMTFHGTFQRDGTSIEVGSLVTMPLTTFSLVTISETPPIFLSTSNVYQSVCCGGVYAAEVFAGNPINNVPEPNTICIISMAVLMFATIRRLRF